MRWDGWGRDPPPMSEVSQVRSLPTTPRESLRQPRRPRAGATHSCAQVITRPAAHLPCSVQTKTPRLDGTFRGSMGQHPAYHSRNRGSQSVSLCPRGGAAQVCVFQRHQTSSLSSPAMPLRPVLGAGCNFLTLLSPASWFLRPLLHSCLPATRAFLDGEDPQSGHSPVGSRSGVCSRLRAHRRPAAAAWQRLLSLGRLPPSSRSGSLKIPGSSPAGDAAFLQLLLITLELGSMSGLTDSHLHGALEPPASDGRSAEERGPARKPASRDISRLGV